MIIDNAEHEPQSVELTGKGKSKTGRGLGPFTWVRGISEPGSLGSARDDGGT